MTKTKQILFRYLFFVAIVVALGVTIGFSTFGATVAYADEADPPLIVGATYTYADNGDEYSVYILSDSEYELHAVSGDEVFDYKGSYSYTDGKLTLTAFGETIGAYYIQGSNLVEIVESDITETETPTFFGRISEWVAENKAEIITVIGNAVLLIIIIVREMAQKKKFTIFGSDLLSIGKSVSTTETSQGAVVNVTNELIKGYNKFEKTLLSFKQTESERYKILLAAFTQTRAILEILITVYANSKNIPQGVKDLVNLKYANVLKLIGDDNKLKANVESEVSEKEAEKSAAVDGESEG